MSDAQQEEVNITTASEATRTTADDDYVDPWEEGIVDLPLAMD